METMHYREKKKSYKLAITLMVLFVVFGGTLVTLGIIYEKEPVIIGSTESDIQRLVDLDKEQDETLKIQNMSINYEVTDVKNSDTSNKKFKSDMTLPKVSIEGEELTELNTSIDSNYNGLYNKFKEQMATADSNYTYIVSYNKYENMVGSKKILSLTIYLRIRDDDTKENTVEQITTYNIDLATKETLSEFDIAKELLGKDYKTIIKSKVQDYVVDKGMMKDSEFTYAITGFESFYIKDGVFHIVFNEGKLVDSKHGLIDVEVTKEG